jgi:hypothetical protein
VRVHFDGWAERWDEDINVIDGADRLAAWSDSAAVGPQGREELASTPLRQAAMSGGPAVGNESAFDAHRLQVMTCVMTF